MTVITSYDLGDGTTTYDNAARTVITVVEGGIGHDGADGPAGADGAAGVGVPPGGTIAQALVKASGTDYDTEWADQSGGGGGGSFPDFTGDGSPEGVVTADVGKSYVDTLNGGIYLKVIGSDSAGWTASGAVFDGNVAGPGLTFHDADVHLYASGDGRVFIGDPHNWNDLGNGITFEGSQDDGAQRLKVQLGAAGEFTTQFNPDGSTVLPGALGVAGDVTANGVLLGAGGGAVDSVNTKTGDVVLTAADVGADDSGAAAAAEANAATDATTKADAAQAAAVAASDPAGSAAAAQIAAVAAADTYTDAGLAAEVTRADGAYDAAGAAAAAQATAATDAASKVAAEAALRVTGDAGSVSIAAADATTKANAAQSAAIAAAATDATTKANAAAAASQPLDADLTAIAALTTTAFGRGLLDDADAAAARTSLALGTLATQSGTFSGTSSGTNTGDQTITLTGDTTGSGTGSFATTNTKLNGTSLAGLATGLLKNTTGTGVPSIAVAADVPNLAASQITSGVLAVGRLATGTPDGTKFVRDDGTLVTPTAGILASTATTKGDILAATAASTIARVGIGTDGQVLTADAASTPGLKWATPSGGSPDIAAWTPAMSGLLTASFDPALITSTNVTTSDGQIFFTKLAVSKTITANNVVYIVSTAQTTPTASRNFIAVFDSSGNRLAVTADIGAAGYTPTGVHTQALPAPLTITGSAGAYVWVAMMFASGGATPIFAGLHSPNALYGPNVNLAAGALRTGKSATGQTSIPSTITPSTFMSSNTDLWWVGLS